MTKNAPIHTAILLLGSNLGDRTRFLSAAIAGLAENCGEIVQTSAVYESEVWGATDQQDYLNIAVALQTFLSPEELLHCCQQIEAAQGRERITRWAARTLDIDILFYDDTVVDLPHLKIPHPLLGERRFVLEPLLEVIPTFRHPLLGISIKEMHTACTDAGRVWKAEKLE